jgi:hypothetical protein
MIVLRLFISRRRSFIYEIRNGDINGIVPSSRENVLSEWSVAS